MNIFHSQKLITIGKNHETSNTLSALCNAFDTWFCCDWNPACSLAEWPSSSSCGSVVNGNFAF